MRFWACNLLMVIASVGLEAHASPSFEEKLRTTYSEVVGLTADIHQIKKSPYFVKPLESEVTLTYTAEKIIWQLKSPLASTATLDASGLILEQDGKTTLLKADANPKLQGMIEVLRAVLRLDLDSLRTQYHLVFLDHALRATARPDLKTTPLIKAMEIEFAADSKPATMRIEAPDEETTLTFHHVVFTKRSKP